MTGDRRIAIMQSNYIPWKGFFDLIGSVDELVLLDDVQFGTGTWRHRNRIKTPQGLLWLSVPVRHTGACQRIDEMRIADPGWAARHWATLQHCYRRAPHFDELRGVFAPLYEALALEERLSAVNRHLLDACCEALGITTPMRWSTDYDSEGRSTERLLSLCRAAGASRYLAVPGMRTYFDEAVFAAAGVAVDWMDYAGYPEYDQPHGPFEHAVSVLDLLFCCGRAGREQLHCFGGR